MTEPCAHCEPGPARPRWYAQPRTWAVGAAVPLAAAGLVWPPLRATTELFGRYVAATWWAIGLGLLLGGVIERFVPKEYIAKGLSAPGPRTVLLATGLGFLFSGCSHGCLALSMELHKKGAAPAAVISFLLASPWASLSLTLVMVSLFGLKGLVIVMAALLVACISGLVFLQLGRRGLIEPNPHTVRVDPDFSIAQDLAQRLARYRLTARQVAQDGRAVLRGAWTLADMVVWWLLIGFFLASLLGSLIPHEAFARYFGPTLLGLAATMLAAAVIEICSEGSAPLAFELYRHTGALGNSFAFLMGGVVTDVTELGLIWTNLGKRAALWMLALTLPQVFLLGLLLNRW
ncbi:MAG: permease [Candidatus Omnitrophica bacterium]|nr:permease [Candidatus Omnitrophota bacterium]